MYTIELLIKPTKYERRETERRYFALFHIHNVCVKHAKKLLTRLRHDHEYQDWKSEYKGADEDRREELKELMAQRREELGLTKAAFESYLKVCGKRFSKLLSSQQVQVEADRVWQATRKCLFGNGKRIHFKKFADFKTIGGKSNKNGVKFDKNTMTAEWNDLFLRCVIMNKNSVKEQIYITHALQDEISYCMIKRRMFSGGYRYYLVIYLKGSSPQNIIPGEAVMGIDPGVSSEACVSDDNMILEELAPRCEEYEKEISRILVKMDASRRQSNPERYNERGEYIKKHYDTPWKYSNNYRRLHRKLKTLYRKKTEYTLYTHRNLCNRVLTGTKLVLVESMNFSALQKKAKKTERQEKLSEVKKKDGTVVNVHKYKKKKRYGKSINRRSPALFVSELKRKAKHAGIGFEKISTRSFKASQYDHVQDKCIKTTVNQRSKIIGGEKVQRDLYSAFLIWNADETRKHPDREKCMHRFEDFIKRQNELISKMKTGGITMKQCFGF